MSCVCPQCNSFSFGGLHMEGFFRAQRWQQLKEQALRLVVRGLWRPIRIGERLTGYWWLHLGVNANEAKVFRAHAAPLGLCDLINALNLLANQQKDGDSPNQSIVRGLHATCRKGIMEGLRSFIKKDNHRAVDVMCVRAQCCFMSENRSSVRLTQRRPSGKEQMS